MNPLNVRAHVAALGKPNKEYEYIYIVTCVAYKMFIEITELLLIRTESTIVLQPDNLIIDKKSSLKAIIGQKIH